VIDLMLAIDGVIAPLIGLPTFARRDRHQSFLSASPTSKPKAGCRT
jgi:hypothetical protein